MSPAPTSLERALLGLLRQKPQSGYDLRKLFSTTPVRHFSDSPGSIYPALRRLEARGWIAAESKTNGRQRQVFRATPAGKGVLVHWLRQPVTPEDVIWRLDDLLLRFAFFDGNVEREAAIDFLADMEKHLTAYIAELEKYASVSGLLKRVSTGGLAFSHGIEGYKGQLSWARRARRKLTEASS